MTDDLVEPLLERIAELEQANRRWKGAALGLLLVVVGGFALGGVGSVFFAFHVQTTHQRAVQAMMEAEAQRQHAEQALRQAEQARRNAEAQRQREVQKAEEMLGKQLRDLQKAVEGELGKVVPEKP
jgi:esterase/lipase